MPNRKTFKNCVIVKGTETGSLGKNIVYKETYYFYSPVIGYLGLKWQFSFDDKSNLKPMEELDWQMYKKVD